MSGTSARRRSIRPRSARLFLYREVLGRTMEPPQGVVRPRKQRRLTVVLTRGEVAAVLRELMGTKRLVAELLYGSGLRLLESFQLRVKDLDLDLTRSRSAEARAATIA